MTTYHRSQSPQVLMCGFSADPCLGLSSEVRYIGVVDRACAQERHMHIVGKHESASQLASSSSGPKRYRRRARGGFHLNCSHSTPSTGFASSHGLVYDPPRGSTPSLYHGAESRLRHSLQLGTISRGSRMNVDSRESQMAARQPDHEISGAQDRLARGFPFAWQGSWSVSIPLAHQRGHYRLGFDLCG